MKSIVHLASGLLLLSALAFDAGAAGTNRLCNGRQNDVVFAMIDETSKDADAGCEQARPRCDVTLQGWFTLKPGVCMDVAAGSGGETYLSIFVKDAPDRPYRPELFPVTAMFYKDRNEKNSGIVNVSMCMPVGAFKKQLPGDLAPLLNPAGACAPGEALHPINFVMRGAPATTVVVTLNQ